MAAGQAGAALHTMAILQAYQAEVLKEMDEGDGVTPEAVKELRRAIDLALRATKHTARAVGCSMAGLVAAERHLWLNLTEIREKEKVFLLDAPISSSGLFGDAVNTVVDKFSAAKTHLAAFKQFMPRRAREPASASSSRERPAPRKEPVGRVSDPVHPPPYTVWGARGRSATRQRPHKRVDLKRPNKPPQRLLRVAPDARIRKRRASPASLDRDGPLKRICPSLRCSPPPTVPPSPLRASRGAQATSPLQRPLKVRETSGFLPSELLQVADIVHAVRDAQRFPPTLVSPALAFTASLGHASRHEDAVSSPLRRPDTCPSLLRDVQSWDPVSVSPLICSIPLPLSAFLHACCEQRKRSFCSTTGSLLSSAQRGNRGGTLFGPKPRLLQPVLSSPQEGWGFAPYTRSAQAELLPLQREIQDADAQEHSFPGPRGGLVRHCRLEGCLLPHPGRSETQEVLQVRLRGKGLPIQGSSLWASSGPKDVHQVYGCGSCPVEAPGHPDPQLLGRLAHFNQFHGAGGSSQGLAPSPPLRAWPPAEWSEERAHSSPADLIFGGLPGLNLYAGPSGPCSCRKHPIVLGPLQARPSRVSGPVSQAPRPHGSSFPSSSLGAAPYETVPLVDEVPGYSPLLAIPPPTKSVRCLSQHPLSVAGPQFSPERSEYGGSLPSPNDSDGCLPLRVGGGLRGKAGLRCLVRQVPSLAHKRPGVESGSFSSSSLSSVPGALSCHRQDGQHGGGV